MFVDLMALRNSASSDLLIIMTEVKRIAQRDPDRLLKFISVAERFPEKVTSDFVEQHFFEKSSGLAGLKKASERREPKAEVMKLIKKVATTQRRLEAARTDLQKKIDTFEGKKSYPQWNH